MAEVTLESVRKEFGNEVAVESLDLTIEEGETLGIVGPSGCGKTTTLRMIAGFETPTAGRVLFDGEEVTHKSPERRNVGLVFQSYALFNNMSVIANVAFGLKMQGLAKTERRERAMELLEMFGIEELADRDPRTLSGGQQQRVGLARALAIEPEILLLDEPMTGLDAQLKERLQVEIGDLLDRLDVTVLYVTHDQEEAMIMADRIAVLNDGHLEQVGTPSEIYESPANEFVASFVGTSNLIPATIHDGHVDFGFAEYPAEHLAAHEGDVTVLTRPEDVTIGDGRISARIVDLYYLGERIQASAELEDGTVITLHVQGRSDEVEPGAEVSLDLDVEHVHVVGQ